MTAPAYTPRTITVGASREPTENPFAHYAPEYHAKGWNVVWLPPRAKRLTETGVTGHAGKDADANLIQRWIDQHPHANIGVRMPDDLIGIDVDQYGNKTGGDTLAQLEATLGPLPPTIISTSREDGVSGIRFYRVPAGRKWSGDAGKDIEIIQRVHRYAAVWPSVHPEGRIYYWHLDKGDEWERHDLVPTASRIAPLPEEWVAYLTESDTYVPPAERVHVTSEQARQILDSDDMCKAVRNAYDNAKQRMSSRNRHDGARDAVLNLTRLGEQGHKGAGDAVEALRADFIASVGKDPQRRCR